MGATLRGGRWLDRAGRTGPRRLSPIVNETLARRCWPNEDPIEQGILMNQPESLAPPDTFPLADGSTRFPRRIVVGIIADLRAERAGARDRSGSLRATRSARRRPSGHVVPGGAHDSGPACRHGSHSVGDQSARQQPRAGERAHDGRPSLVRWRSAASSCCCSAASPRWR